MIIALDKQLMELGDQKYPPVIETVRINLLSGVQLRWQDFPKAVLLACVLDPRFKSLWFLPKQSATEIHDLLRGECDAATNQHKPEVKIRAQKKSKPSFEEIAFRGSQNESIDEVTRYLSELQPSKDKSPYEWWREKQVSYIILPLLAKKYLSIPASNAPS